MKASAFVMEAFAAVTPFSMSIALDTTPSTDDAYRMVWDDFQDGSGIGTPDAKWFYCQAENHLDGEANASERGLRVSSKGATWPWMMAAMNKR